MGLLVYPLSFFLATPVISDVSDDLAAKFFKVVSVLNVFLWDKDFVNGRLLEKIHGFSVPRHLALKEVLRLDALIRGIVGIDERPAFDAKWTWVKAP